MGKYFHYAVYFRLPGIEATIPAPHLSFTSSSSSGHIIFTMPSMFDIFEPIGASYFQQMIETRRYFSPAIKSLSRFKYAISGAEALRCAAGLRRAPCRRERGSSTAVDFDAAHDFRHACCFSRSILMLRGFPGFMLYTTARLGRRAAEEADFSDWRACAFRGRWRHAAASLWGTSSA